MTAVNRPPVAALAVERAPDRAASPLAALLAIALVAASGGLLGEMNRMAQPAGPAVVASPTGR